MTLDYRPGNVNPGKGILNQLRKAVMIANKASKKITRFRSDSAAHNLEIMLFCEENKILFYISLDKNSVIMTEINAIDETEWKKHPTQEGVEYAESTYAMYKNKKNKIAIRILVLRWENPEQDLFSGKYGYHVIGTNDWDIDQLSWLDFHNKRMGSENVNKELKTNFNAAYTPSHSFDKNRGYFMIATLAYNITQIFKLFYLESSCVKWTVKTLQFRFINSVGQIVRHARSTICYLINLPDPSFRLFRHCQAVWVGS